MRGETPAAERAVLLNEALGLWRGPALPELADMPFAQAETLRLEELSSSCSSDESTPTSSSVVTTQSFRAGKARRRASAGRGAPRQLMLALYRSGRPGRCAGGLPGRPPDADERARTGAGRRSPRSGAAHPGYDETCGRRHPNPRAPPCAVARSRVLVVTGGLLIAAALVAGVIALTGRLSRSHRRGQLDRCMSIRPQDGRRVDPRRRQARSGRRRRGVRVGNERRRAASCASTRRRSR